MPKTKSESGNRRKRKALLEGKGFGPISYELMFGIWKAKYHEQEGVPIVRLMSQLSAIDRVSYIELEQGARNPEGIWVCLSKKRNDLEALDGGLN